MLREWGREREREREKEREKAAEGIGADFVELQFVFEQRSSGVFLLRFWSCRDGVGFG